MNNYYNNYTQPANTLTNTNSDPGVAKSLLLAVAFAALGGAIGAGIWIVLSLLGKMGVYAGAIAGFVGFMGFQKAGRSSKIPAFFIALIISLGLYALGVYIGFAIDILYLSDYSISFGEAFSLIGYLLRQEAYQDSLVSQLLWGSLTYIGGAAVCIVLTLSALKSKPQNTTPKY